MSGAAQEKRAKFMVKLNAMGLETEAGEESDDEEPVVLPAPTPNDAQFDWDGIDPDDETIGGLIKLVSSTIQANPFSVINLSLYF